MNDPLVSVVTPFYNTASYLADCIESVLAADYPNFEYILSDNCSEDGSSEIAQTYAQRDRRIRLVRQPRLLPQVVHYNTALSAISGDSVYCKMVQADDRIFPPCLREMVNVFEQSKAVGLVSSYDLKGNVLRGSRFPWQSTILPGKEMGRLFLRMGVYVFGSPSTVMYRSSLVHDQKEFFREGLLHEDTEKCMEILRTWDFGFVRQVLSFSRDDNASISTSVRDFRPQALDRYIMVKRFASEFLDPDEARTLVETTKRDYYSVLAEEALRPRGSRFWKYNRGGLKTILEQLDGLLLGVMVARKVCWLLVNPGMAISHLAGVLRRVWYGLDARMRRA